MVVTMSGSPRSVNSGQQPQLRRDRTTSKWVKLARTSLSDPWNLNLEEGLEPVGVCVKRDTIFAEKAYLS